ncbi:hypothetical protein HK102_009999 [Quaeritorhiza haematococci]|nr:hypothetical protein HK102_009999 [Quaeritorhiza haematococci]
MALVGTPFAQAMIKEITSTHQSTAEKVLSWFLENMPEAYFREIPEEIRMSHVQAIIALEMTGQNQDLTLMNKEKTVYTYIKPLNYVGLLSEVVESLPADKPLREANIYTSRDGKFVIDVFELGTSPKKFSISSPEDSKLISDILAILGSDSEQSLQSFLLRCDSTYVRGTEPATIAEHFSLVQRIDHGTVVEIHEPVVSDQVMSDANSPTTTNGTEDHLNGNDITKLIIVTKPVEYNDGFKRVVRHLSTLGIDIVKANLLKIDPSSATTSSSENLQANKIPPVVDFSDDPQIMILTIYVRSLSDGSIISRDSDIGRRLLTDLTRLQWVDESVLRFTKRYSIRDAEIIAGLSHLLHCILAENKPLVYTHVGFPYVAFFPPLN